MAGAVSAGMGFEAALAAAMEELAARGVSVAGWGLAWVRMLPTAVLVPAFGLRALPIPVRILLGGLLVVGVSPALKVAAVEHSGAATVGLELIRGLPVAVSAASGLWAATMAGGMMDALRGRVEHDGFGVVDGDASALGTLLTLVACIVFLEGGGVTTVAAALSEPSLAFEQPLIAATRSVALGIQVAVAIAAPVAIAAIVLDVVAGIAARSALPVALGSLLVPVRAVALLGITAILFTAVSEALADWVWVTLPASTPSR